ncbi:MAG TPA: hypothetical protein H9702_08010 [Candidatus Merdibacter merdavium]|uniref:Uncharacterized protein n=1 Tax=Candidatus Merdibacter merdavium TaxID=2838692 RepID=A0A9D2NSD4_9FIRM|nr:hypothetical protein [Candidatus Merdibacter merdavium]
MNILDIITIKLKEKKGHELFYYYEIDSLKIKDETSGIISIDETIFAQLPETIPEYIPYVMELYKKGQVKILRTSYEPLVFSDCIDSFGLAAAGHLIKHYRQHKEIPESYISVSHELLKYM